MSNAPIGGIVATALYLAGVLWILTLPPSHALQSKIQIQDAKSDTNAPSPNGNLGSASKNNSKRRPNDQETTKIDHRSCYGWNDPDLCAQMRMARAAEAQSDYTKYGFWLLVATFIATTLAAAAAAATVFILRKEFHATHRPKLIVHKFKWISDMTQQVNARFVVVNAGAADARIIKCRAIIFNESDVPDLPEVEVEKTTLKPGEYVEIHLHAIRISDFQAIIGSKREERGFDSKPIRCAGFIRYVDNSATQRETGFDRLLNVERRIWIAREGSDFEYSY